MEHRLSPRCPLSRPVAVDCPRASGAVLTICDISLDGMSVESPPRFLPLNAFVRVAFSTGSAERGDEFILDAMVVRHTQSGAAIMFSDLDVRILRALRTALHDRADATRQPAWNDRPTSSVSVAMAR